MRNKCTKHFTMTFWFVYCIRLYGNIDQSKTQSRDEFTRYLSTPVTESHLYLICQ